MRSIATVLLICLISLGGIQGASAQPITQFDDIPLSSDGCVAPEVFLDNIRVHFPDSDRGSLNHKRCELENPGIRVLLAMHKFRTLRLAMHEMGAGQTYFRWVSQIYSVALSPPSDLCSRGVSAYLAVRGGSEHVFFCPGEIERQSQLELMTTLVHERRHKDGSSFDHVDCKSGGVQKSFDDGGCDKSLLQNGSHALSFCFLERYKSLLTKSGDIRLVPSIEKIQKRIVDFGTVDKTLPSCQAFTQDFTNVVEIDGKRCSNPRLVERIRSELQLNIPEGELDTCESHNPYRRVIDALMLLRGSKLMHPSGRSYYDRLTDLKTLTLSGRNPEICPLPFYFIGARINTYRIPDPSAPGGKERLGMCVFDNQLLSQTEILSWLVRERSQLLDDGVEKSYVKCEEGPFKGRAICDLGLSAKHATTHQYCFVERFQRSEFFNHLLEKTTPARAALIKQRGLNHLDDLHQNYLLVKGVRPLCP